MRELTPEPLAVGAMRRGGCLTLPPVRVVGVRQVKRLLPIFVLCAGAAVPWSTMAQSSDIFLCVDDQGNKSFQNVGSGKGCKRVDVGPGAVATRAAAACEPGHPTGGGGSGHRLPAAFPRVDRDTSARATAIGGASSRTN